VCAHSRPAWGDNAQGRDWVLERHDAGANFDVGVIGLFHHCYNISHVRDVSCRRPLHTLIEHRLPRDDVALLDALCELVDRELPDQVDEEVVLLH